MYTIHSELDDNTICDAVATFSNKAEAKRVARLIAKCAGADVVAVLVMADESVVWECRT